MTSPATTVTPAVPPPALRAPAPRVLGTVAMLASPMMLVEHYLSRLADGDAERNLVMGVCSLVYMIGFACGAIGLRALRATGDGPAARAVYRVQMVGLGLAAVWAAWFVVTPHPEPTILLTVTDVAWPLSHVLMLVVGVLALRAGRLRGWRRFPALVCGLALPTFVALRGLGVPPAVAGASFPLLTTLGFSLLGLIVFQSGPETPPAARAR